MTGSATPSWRAPLLTFGTLLLAMVVLLWINVPWDPLPGPDGASVAPDAGLDFAGTHHAVEDAYHRRLWPAVLGGMGVSLLTALALGLTPLGSRIVHACARPFGGGRLVAVVAGTTVLTALGVLLALPFDLWRAKTQRDYGLVVQGWDAYARDRLVGYGIGLGATLLGLVIFFVLARRVRRWWIPGGVLAAGLVFASSFVYPVLVEPAFHDFRSMPAGPVRDALLDLAAADGTPVSDVLIADESRRSTQLNAYVSGIGSSRRIVVFDTTLEKLPPEQTRSIIAHELAHVKQDDVLYGTAATALGAAAGVCLVFVLLGSRRLRRAAGVSEVTDPGAAALLLALVALLGAAATPVSLAVSRKVEARADVHALGLTRDPGALIAMQRRISATNLAELDSHLLLRLFLSSHPTGPQRIATTRTWARINEVPLPPAPAPTGR